jgi:GNAT superfamily N-acetyltransferase
MSKTPATFAEPVAVSDLSPAALAQVVEFSEARAYASLFAAAQALEPSLGFSTQSIGGAVLLRATQAPRVLIGNRVLGLGLSQPVSEQLLDTIVAAYEQGQSAFGIELSPQAEPAALRDWLKARRLRKTAPAQVLVRDGSAPPPRYAAWAKATGLRVEQVGVEHAATLARLCCDNFNLPQVMQQLLALGMSAPGWRRWLAFDGDVPVGGSLSYVEAGLAWLGWTSVLPSHRGRWVHAGVVARELDDAHAAGCQWVTTETAVSTAEKPDAAYFNLRKFGFLDAYQRAAYLYQPRRAPA